MSGQNGQAPLRPGTGDVKEIPITLEGVVFVFGNVGTVSGQLEHLVEVIPIPTSTNNDEYVLELGALDAVLRLEWRMAGQIAAKSDNFLVWNGP